MMKLRSTLRDEEYATKTNPLDQDRDIKHAILIEKQKGFNRVTITKRYNGHKVNFSDVSYMQAI